MFRLLFVIIKLVQRCWSLFVNPQTHTVSPWIPEELKKTINVLTSTVLTALPLEYGRLVFRAIFWMTSSTCKGIPSWDPPSPYMHKLSILLLNINVYKPFFHKKNMNFFHCLMSLIVFDMSCKTRSIYLLDWFLDENHSVLWWIKIAHIVHIGCIQFFKHKYTQMISKYF